MNGLRGKEGIEGDGSKLLNISQLNLNRFKTDNYTPLVIEFYGVYIQGVQLIFKASAGRSRIYTAEILIQPGMF